MKKLLLKSQQYLRKHGATILSCCSALGVVITSAMTVKATIRVMELRANATDEKRSKESFKICAPVIFMGASTILCIFGANALNKRKQATLASAYLMLANSYKEFRERSNVIFGEDASVTVRNALIQDKYKESGLSLSGSKHLFFDEYRYDFFERTIEEVILAEYELNRNFILRGTANLNEFYSFLGLAPIETGDVLGWSRYAGESFYGYSWIDFEHFPVVMDDGLECYILNFPFEPTMDYESY